MILQDPVIIFKIAYPLHPFLVETFRMINIVSSQTKKKIHGLQYCSQPPPPPDQKNVLNTPPIKYIIYIFRDSISMHLKNYPSSFRAKSFLFYGYDVLPVACTSYWFRNVSVVHVQQVPNSFGAKLVCTTLIRIPHAKVRDRLTLHFRPAGSEILPTDVSLACTRDTMEWK